MQFHYNDLFNQVQCVHEDISVIVLLNHVVSQSLACLCYIPLH